MKQYTLDIVLLIKKRSFGILSVPIVLSYFIQTMKCYILAVVEIMRFKISNTPTCNLIGILQLRLYFYDNM